MELHYEPLTEAQAKLIAGDYQYLIGDTFLDGIPELIEKVYYEKENDYWVVYVSTSIRGEHIRNYLDDYLKRNRVQFDPRRYGLTRKPE